jgi:predicted nucleic acid-binding protein
VTAPTLPAGQVDTDIFVDALRRWPAATAFLAALGPANTSVSIVSVMELIAGCRNATILARLMRFLAPFPVLPLNEPISYRACWFMQSFTLSDGLQMADALIAATAVEIGLPLYTRNLRHFHMIPGLVVIRPY